MAKPEEPRHIAGNRFKASVSGNRMLADITDRKGPGKLTVLKRQDIQGLRTWIGNLIERGDTKGVNLSNPALGQKIAGLNPEDVRELYELSAALLEIMSDGEA